MKLVSKKLTLGLGCAVAALTFTACGGGVPDCDDSDVQDAVKKLYLENFLKINNFSDVSGDVKESIRFNEEAKMLINNELKLTMSNFITDKTDEKNRIVCQASITGNIADEKAREAFTLLEKAEAADIKLVGDEVLTDKEFDNFIKQNFGSSKNFDKLLDRYVDGIHKEFHNSQRNLTYIMKQTDNGELVIEVESGFPTDHLLAR